MVIPSAAPGSWELHQVSDLVLINLHDRAVDETVAGHMTSLIIATLDEFFRRFESKIDIDVTAQELRLFP